MPLILLARAIEALGRGARARAETDLADILLSAAAADAGQSGEKTPCDAAANVLRVTVGGVMATLQRGGAPSEGKLAALAARLFAWLRAQAVF